MSKTSLNSGSVKSASDNGIIRFTDETDIVAVFGSVTFRGRKYDPDNDEYSFTNDLFCLDLIRYDPTIFPPFVPSDPVSFANYVMYADFGVVVDDTDKPTRAAIMPHLVDRFCQALSNQQLVDYVPASMITWSDWTKEDPSIFIMQNMYQLINRSRATITNYGSGVVEQQDDHWSQTGQVVTLKSDLVTHQTITASPATEFESWTARVPDAMVNPEQQLPVLGPVPVADVCIWLRRLNTGVQHMRPVISEPLMKIIQPMWPSDYAPRPGLDIGPWAVYTPPIEWHILGFPEDQKCGVDPVAWPNAILYCRMLTQLTSSDTGVWGGNPLTFSSLTGARVDVRSKLTLSSSTTVEGGDSEWTSDEKVQLRNRVKYSYGPSQLKDAVSHLIQPSAAETTKQKQDISKR